MITPNILNPHKLYRNLRYPIHEFIHIKHRQYPIEDSQIFFAVEHYFINNVVTLDIIKKDPTRDLKDLFKKLFREDFYYGHCQYFPQTFKLQKRIYVKDDNRDLEEIIKENFINN